MVINETQRGIGLTAYKQATQIFSRLPAVLVHFEAGAVPFQSDIATLGQRPALPSLCTLTCLHLVFHSKLGYPVGVGAVH